MSEATIDAGAVAPATETAVLDTAVAASPAADTGAPAAPTIDESLDAVWDKLNPKRGDDGKFSPKTDTPAEGAATGDTATKDSADQPLVASAEPAKPAIDAPHSWSAEEKARWATVPPETQAYIAKRETEAQQFISRLGNDKQTLEQQIRAYEPLDQLIQVHKDDFARRGISPAQGFAVLLDAQRQLDANPVNGLVQIGLTYGIDLRPIFAGQQQQGPNPEVVQLNNKVSRLEQQLSQTQSKVTERETQEQQRQRQAEQAETTELTRTIEDFKKDKPYFEDVKPMMARLLTPVLDASGRQIAPPAANDLAEAYDMAVNAKPDIRQRIQADQRKAEEDKRTAEAQAKADAARKAASVNVKSAPSSPNPKTTDDALNEIARRHYG